MTSKVYKEKLKLFEKPFLLAIMQKVNYNESKASRELGLSRTTLRNKLKEFNITRSEVTI